MANLKIPMQVPEAADVAGAEAIYQIWGVVIDGKVGWDSLWNEEMGAISRVHQIIRDHPTAKVGVTTAFIYQQGEELYDSRKSLHLN